MLQFDIRDKKPKVYNIAVISAVTAAVLAVLLTSFPDIALQASGCVISVYLAITLIFLIQAFRKQIEYNPYSYNTIYYMGFAIFVTFLLITHTITAIRAFVTPDMMNAVTMFGIFLYSAKSYMLLTFPFILLFSAALCVSNIFLIRREGARPVNFLGILLSVIMIGVEVFLFFSDYYVMGSQTEVMIHDLVINLIAALYLYFECMLIGAIVANVIAAKHEPEKNKDFVIILGCGIRKDGTPTPLLKGRADRAIRFYREQIEASGKAPVFITSGGQGKNEVISESESLKNYLLQQGIPEDHILMEDKSSDTFQNMKNSKEIIWKIDPNAKVAFSTTNYHVFRSGLKARRVKMRAVGMGAKTKWYFWPNASVREFVGILTEHRLKQALILAGMIAAYTILTLLVFGLL